MPKPDAKIDMSKPVYFFWKEPLGSGIRGTHAVAHWYRKHGFKNVFGATTEESALDKQHRYMAAVLIGQKPAQVTVQRVTKDYPRPIPRR